MNPFVWRKGSIEASYELHGPGGAVFMTCERLDGFGWRAVASPVARRLAGRSFAEVIDPVPAVAVTVLLADMHPAAINLDDHRIVYEPKELETLLRM